LNDEYHGLPGRLRFAPVAFVLFAFALEFCPAKATASNESCRPLTRSRVLGGAHI
jgi:hypothetical protein